MLQVKDIAAPLNDLKDTPYLKLAASLIIDILGTRYIGVPVILQLVVGSSGENNCPGSATCVRAKLRGD